MNPSSARSSWLFRSIASVVLMLTSFAIFASAFAQPGGAVQNKDSQADVEANDNSAAPAEQTANSSTVGGKGVRIVASFTVFLLAVFVGVEVINKVPPTLHTPLMSGSNAISGITVIGALLAAGHIGGGFGALLGLFAVIFSMINVAGGFLVTHRMLMMFKKR